VAKTEAGVASSKTDETSEAKGGTGSGLTKILGKFGGEGDGKVYNIQLCLPGVQQPVNVIVSSACGLCFCCY